MNTGARSAAILRENKMSKILGNRHRIVFYAVKTCENHRDSKTGELNLTAIDEEAKVKWDLSEEEYTANNFSFLIFEELQRCKLV
jgi:hypothetical protein